MFKKLCQLHITLVYGTLLIQFLNVCKSLFFLFLILKYTIKLSISFSAVNQPKIAKMDNFPLLQNIERIQELKFKCMGSYISYTVSQIKTYPFPIVHSAPSNDREEHWITIAGLDKNYYFADSLGRKRSLPYFEK